MLFDGDILPSMAQFPAFDKTFRNYAKGEAWAALLGPVFSPRRLYDAHFAWRSDLERMGDREAELDGEPDHYKQAGLLAFWLRRESPVVEFNDLQQTIGEEGGLYPSEEEKRDLLTKYGSEYLAFDFGFQLCQYYVSAELDGGIDDAAPAVTREYLQDICYFLKFKHVSPHSLYLIYRSLFLACIRPSGA